MVKGKYLWSSVIQISLPFQGLHWSASDCHFLLSGFCTNWKGSQYPNPIFLNAYSLIHHLQLFCYSSGYCCSKFPNPQILHSLLDLPLFLDRTFIVCYPRKGSSFSIFPVCCLSSVFHCFTCSYLDCSRWEGLWPALNLTKIKQPESWIIYIFKSFPSYLLLTLCTKSPHLDHLLWLARVLFLLSYFLTDMDWDILTWPWILWYFCNFFFRIHFDQPYTVPRSFSLFSYLIQSLFSFNPYKSPS